MNDNEEKSFAEKYREEIERIAKEAADGIRSGDIGRNDFEDWLHETIDGHGFVIYTAKAKQVLEVSKNDCAIFDEMGAPSWSDWSTAFSQSAYFAMCADVRAEFDTIDLEEEDEEEDDDADEDE